MLSLISMNSLKPNMGRAFQPIPHFFVRMSAQPLPVLLLVSRRV